VLVTVTYRVTAHQLDDFTDVMNYLENHRRRTGGYQWALYRDLADPEMFVEHFLVSSWAEHLRQHHRRTVVSDEWMQRSRAFMTPPGASHFISSTSDGAMAPFTSYGDDDLDPSSGEND